MSDQSVLGRRAALKAAVGGGVVAATTLSGARIQRFSVSPAYAAAASPCVVPTLTPWTTWRDTTSATYSGTTYAGWFTTNDIGLFTVGASGAAAPPAEYADGLTNGTVLHLVQADPVQLPSVGGTIGSYPHDDRGTATVTSNPFVLPRGRSVTFTFRYRTRDHRTHVAAQRLQAQYLAPGSSTWVDGFSHTTTVGTGSQRDIFNPARPGWNTGTMTIVPPVTGTYRFRFRHSFVGRVEVNTERRSNDIAVTFPSVVCV